MVQREIEDTYKEQLLENYDKNKIQDISSYLENYKNISCNRK
jgi:hypothetical protein